MLVSVLPMEQCCWNICYINNSTFLGGKPKVVALQLDSYDHSFWVSDSGGLVY